MKCNVHRCVYLQNQNTEISIQYRKIQNLLTCWIHKNLICKHTHYDFYIGGRGLKNIKLKFFFIKNELNGHYQRVLMERFMFTIASSHNEICVSLCSLFSNFLSLPHNFTVQILYCMCLYYLALQTLFRFAFCLTGSASSDASLSDSQGRCWFYCP